MPMSIPAMNFDRSGGGETAFVSICRSVTQRVDSLHLQKCLDTPPQLVEIVERGLGEFARLEFGIGHRPLHVTIQTMPAVANCHLSRPGVIMDVPDVAIVEHTVNVDRPHSQHAR